ncbi:hypothetical protein LQW54_008594 [Pestalotiopsis sp. IQ-011]
MTTTLETFGASINLSPRDIQALASAQQPESEYGNSSQSIGQACAAAQLAIGEANVDTAPVNATLAGENWSQACVFQPYCIVQPATTDDVSKILKIIKYYGIKFSVRSGGHSPNPGWSNTQGGFLVDLQKLNQVALSTDGAVASVGPGARWGDVIAYLDQHEAAVVGGRIPAVGVGGLMLGGGFWHFSSAFGTVADNVKTFEVVLADGTITNATQTENSDLFWALKGGGPNFGIVTRYDLNTVPARNIWYQVAIYSVDQAPAILEAFAEWQTSGAADVKSTVALIINLDSIILGLLYAEPSEQEPGAFTSFDSLPEPLMFALPATNGTVAGLTDFLGSAFSAEPLRHDYRAASTRIDAGLYKDTYSFWRERALQVRATTGANQTFTIQPISKNLAQQGIEKGGNPMGVPLEDHQWWTTLVDWKNAEDDELVRSVSIDTTAELEKLASERGLDLPFRFMNDASRDQSPLASYGEENVAKLKAIAQKYDVDQLFQKQTDGFLLSKV